ncbi:MAG: aldehyde dehydrogenase family protein [Phycisphaerales bacterium]
MSRRTASSPPTGTDSRPGAAARNGAPQRGGAAAAVGGGSGSGSWEYAPAPESLKVEIAPAYGHFIGGRFTEPGGGGGLETVNPATERVLSRVGIGGASEVDSAVSAAREALGGWSAMDGKERGKYLFRIARRIQERARELAVLESMDGGKPIRESRDVDLPLVSQHFFYHAGWADKLEYAIAGGRGVGGAPEPGVGSGRGSNGAHEVAPGLRPVGVCGQVIPWNFPLLMAAWKLAPALACGNTVVLKPAETTPLTALRLAEILEECELPAGVVNIVTGDGSTGAAIAEHPGVDKIAFTGSTEVGKKLARVASERGVPITLELGGKSAHIVFEDAALDQAIEGIVQGIYFNQGHVCCAGSRLLVQESVRDEVVRRLESRLARLRVGDPLDKNTDVGAINSRAQLEKIRAMVEEGVAGGATMHEFGGCALPEKGYWHRPCFLTGVGAGDRIVMEEVFGPVLTVQTFRTPGEAAELANHTPYGLSAGVWTDKGSKIFDLASRLRAGVVWLNTFNKFDAASPFGGYKESGFGREGGRHGLGAYLQRV